VSSTIQLGSNSETVAISGVLKSGLSPTIITTATTITAPFERFYYFMAKTAAAVVITLPLVTTSNVGMELTFKRVGGTNQILGGITATDASGFYQSIIIQGTSIGVASGTTKTLIGTPQNFATLQAMQIQDAGSGTITFASGSTTITIVSQSSGSICIGGRITFAGFSTYVNAYIASTGGIGGTGTYIVATAPSTTGTAVAYTSLQSFGWGTIAVG
jgi:hypothetical protein